MNLEARINEDLKDAMRAKDQARLRGIRAVKAAILLAKTDGSGQSINQEREIQILQKLVKQRRESLDIYTTQNRPDLATIEQEEIDVIEKYLPEQLSPGELENRIKLIIAEVGATSAKDLGKVMAAANKQLAGCAEGRLIADAAKRLLST